MAISPAHKRVEGRARSVAGPHTARGRPAGGGVLALLGALLAGLVLLLVRPSDPTDDTYGFLDWGRDLRHGILPDLQHRTFHPAMVTVDAVVSLFGTRAPNVSVMLSLAALVLLAAGGWRLVARLGIPQPAPALAALLLLSGPVLPVLAYVAYNDLLFACLVMWGAVFALDARRRAAWMVLIAAGLIRPEGWAFACILAGLSLWEGRAELTRQRTTRIVTLLAAAPVIWLGLEWALFGSPMYSFMHLAHQGPQDVAVTVRDDLGTAVGWSVLAAAAFGIGGVLAWGRRRATAVVLPFAIAAPLSLLPLLASSFPLPTRHLAALDAFACVLAAVGAVTPALLLTRRDRARDLSGAMRALAVAGAAVLCAIELPGAVDALHGSFDAIAVRHASDQALAAQITAIRPRLDLARASKHSVAMLGIGENSQLAWRLGLRYADVTASVSPQMRIVVEPSPAEWRRELAHGLTNRSRWRPVPGWRAVSTGVWDIYVRAPA